jgi:hypothetical protein
MVFYTNFGLGFNDFDGWLWVERNPPPTFLRLTTPSG